MPSRRSRTSCSHISLRTLSRVGRLADGLGLGAHVFLDGSGRPADGLGPGVRIFLCWFYAESDAEPTVWDLVCTYSFAELHLAYAYSFADLDIWPTVCDLRCLILIRIFGGLGRLADGLVLDVCILPRGSGCLADGLGPRVRIFQEAFRTTIAALFMGHGFDQHCQCRSRLPEWPKVGPETLHCSLPCRC